MSNLFQVIALKSSLPHAHRGCHIYLATFPIPDLYHRVFGPASFAECAAWHVTHCSAHGHEEPGVNTLRLLARVAGGMGTARVHASISIEGNPNIWVNVDGIPIELAQNHAAVSIARGDHWLGWDLRGEPGQETVVTIMSGTTVLLKRNAIVDAGGIAFGDWPFSV